MFEGCFLNVQPDKVGVGALFVVCLATVCKVSSGSKPPFWGQSSMISRRWQGLNGQLSPSKAFSNL